MIPNSENKLQANDNQIVKPLTSLSKKTMSLATAIAVQIYSGIEICGKHPFATGLIALISLVLSIANFQLDREESIETEILIHEEAVPSKQQIEQITTILINKHQKESQVKDEQIKGLIKAISDLSEGKGNFGSKAQIKAAMTALAQGDTNKAIEFYQKALVINEALGNEAGMAIQYGNLGSVYETRGELDKAIEFHQKALVINEALEHKAGMAANYGNLGIVYHTRGELDKAIEFHQKALVIDEVLGRKAGMAANYGNLGSVYETRGELDKAIEFYQKSLAIDEALGRKAGMAANYANLGLVYQTQGNPAEAKRYWKTSLKLFKEIGSSTAQRVQSWIDGLVEVKK